MGTLIFKVVAIGMLILFALALTFVRFNIESAEYPALLAACQAATVAQREKMIAVVASAASKTDIFNFTKDERDDFLKAGGYCLGGKADSTCKPLPRGVEAEGIAIDIFGGGRCEYRSTEGQVCKPTETNERC